MARKLTVLHPIDSQVVDPTQPLLVSGVATDRGMPEPIEIRSVSVAVDGGPATNATRTVIPNRLQMQVSFKATVSLTDTQDSHSVVVTATDDSGLATSRTVTVFDVGSGPAAGPPAAVLELLELPPNFDVTSPSVRHLMGKLARILSPVASLLTGAGQSLIGPNYELAPNPGGQQVLRVGFWIEPSEFAGTVQPDPAGDYPFPILEDQVAENAFSPVPLLANDTGFAVAVPTSTLQTLLDAALPLAQAFASRHDLSLSSMTVATSASGSVTTLADGDAGGVAFEVTLVESVGTQPSPLDPSFKSPAVIGTSVSAEVGSVFDWVVGILVPIVGLALLGGSAFANVEADRLPGRVNGVLEPLLALIPADISFRNTDFTPPLKDDFPVLTVNWRFFGTSVTALLGNGLINLTGRTQDDVTMTIAGLAEIEGYIDDLAGGASAVYSYTVNDLAPDADKFTWKVAGHASADGPISRGELTQVGSFQARFPLPLHVVPGTYAFTLTVTAIETCGTDPTKTLTASFSMAVEVVVRPNPRVLP